MIPTATNPYDCGGPVRNPQEFYGRSRQLRAIFELIAKRGCANVVGERRSGKTSLLLYVLNPEVQRQYVSQDQQSIYVYLDAEICPEEPEGFFREVFNEVKAQRPDLPISPDEGPMDEKHVRSLLKALRPRRLVIFIDEFENIAQCSRFPPRFFVFLRGLCNYYDLSLVIASCRRLVEFCPQEVITSPFPNIFTSVPLGAFSQEEFEDFLLRSSAPSGVPVWELREDIASMAGYYPYLLQMACRHSFIAWAEQGGLSSGLRPLIRRRFEDEARPYFESVWSRHLSREERKVCWRLAHGEEPLRPEAVWRLEQKGYLRDGRIASDVFAELIRQKQPEDAGEAPMVLPLSSGVSVDERSGNVYLNGKMVIPPLTDHQFKLLRLLHDNRGRICDLDMIIRAVFGEKYLGEVDDQRIAQLVSRLRKRLEPKGRPWRHVQTVHGRGLKLGDGNPAEDPVD